MPTQSWMKCGRSQSNLNKSIQSIHWPRSYSTDCPLQNAWHLEEQFHAAHTEAILPPLSDWIWIRNVLTASTPGNQGLYVAGDQSLSAQQSGVDCFDSLATQNHPAETSENLLAVSTALCSCKLQQHVPVLNGFNFTMWLMTVELKVHLKCAWFW